jgi:hypothetical protein
LAGWQKGGLEGWNVQESQVVLRWVREGMLKGELQAMHRNRVQVLQVRLQTPLPEDLRLAIEGTNDLDTLSRWLEVAATADSLDGFRAAVASR